MAQPGQPLAWRRQIGYKRRILHFIGNLTHSRLDSKDKLSVAIETLASMSTKLKSGKMLRRYL
jgi:hypothetical protein